MVEQEPSYDFYEKPSKLNPILLGGLTIGIISGLPGLSLLNCCCCAGIMGGGAVAVLLYKKEISHHETLLFESSDALILGILSGIVGAVLATLLSSLVFLLVGPVEMEFLRSVITKLAEQLEESGSIPPGALDESLHQLEEALQEGITFGSFLRELAISLIVYPIFSMIGSLIMYGIIGRKK